jgi:hypothetical protein
MYGMARLVVGAGGRSGSAGAALVPGGGGAGRGVAHQAGQAGFGLFYLDPDGDRHEARVKITQVPAATVAKVGATEAFGYWIAFVPRLAGHRPIEVSVYAADGHRLAAPFTLQNP